MNEHRSANRRNIDPLTPVIERIENFNLIVVLIFLMF